MFEQLFVYAVPISGFASAGLGIILVLREAGNTTTAIVGSLLFVLGLILLAFGIPGVLETIIPNSGVTR